MATFTSAQARKSEPVTLEWVSQEPPTIQDEDALKYVYPLDRGLKRYLITTSKPELYFNQSDAYVPLTVAFELPSDYNYLFLEPLKDILRSLVSVYVHTHVDLVEYTVEAIDDQKIVVYTPSYRGVAVRVLRKNLSLLLNQINLKQYYGFEYITSNPLLWYAVSEYHKLYEKFDYDDFLQTETGLYKKVILPDEFENDDSLATVKSMVLKYQSKGYFSSHESLSDSFIHAYIELAVMWQGRVINSHNPIIIKSKIKPLNPESWYHFNAIRLLEGKLPQYTLILDSKDLITLKEAYKFLIASQPLLKGYSYRIVNMKEKMQVEMAFMSYKQVQDFILILNRTKPNDGVSEGCAKSKSCVVKNKHHQRLSGGPKGVLVYKKVGLDDTSHYDIYLEIKQKHLIPYVHYESFLTFPSLHLKRDYEYLFYKNIKSSDIEKDLLDLNERWRRYELISDWGYGMYEYIGKMSRFCLKKDD